MRPIRVKNTLKEEKIKKKEKRKTFKVNIKVLIIRSSQKIVIEKERSQ
jgi:hypothetical protein